MKQTYRTALRLITWNWTTLLLFEVLYKLLTILLIFPGFQKLLQAALQLSGVSFLSNQTICLIIQSPSALFALLFLLFLLAFYVYFEMTALVLYFDYGRQGKPLGVFLLIGLAAKKACSILRPKNLLLLVYVLLILPLAGASLTASSLPSISIPEFILDYIRSRPVLYALYLLGMTALFLISFRWIFSIHEMTLRKPCFRQARAKSRALMRKRLLRTLASFWLWSLLILALFWILSALVLAGLILLIRYTVPAAYAQDTFWYYFRILLQWRSFLLSSCITVSSFALLSAYYYRAQGNDTNLPSEPDPTRHARLLRTCRFLGAFALVLLYALYSLNLIGSGIFLRRELNGETSVTAHRASTQDTPENTLSGLRAAIASGARYAEIDVQQAEDGTLVLLHDTSLKRTTGLDKNIWEVSGQDIQALDAGSWFSPDFAGETLPTLKEFILAAKNKITLVIELKSNGHDKDLAASTVSLIQSLGASDQCIIASMDHTLIQESKRCDPTIRTQLITAVAYGALYQLDDVDIYSVEASFVTRSMVYELHCSGREIFAWTVNDETTMRKLTALHVDSIVTDAPAFAAKTISTDSGNAIIYELVNLMLPQVRTSA